MEKEELLKKIQIWLLGVWDVIADFCREQWEYSRKLCIAVLGVLLVGLVLLITIPSVKASQARKERKAEQEKGSQYQQVEIEPFLSIPLEPAIEDDYVYSRKKVTRWSSETVGDWFSEPDAEMLDDLQKANNKLVDDMMEVVP